MPSTVGPSRVTRGFGFQPARQCQQLLALAAQPVPAMVSDAEELRLVGQGAQPQHHERGPEPSFVSGAADGEPVDGELVRRGGASRPELHLDERLQDLTHPGVRRVLRLDGGSGLLQPLPGKGQVSADHRQPPGLHERRRRLDATGRLRERPSDHLLGLVQASGLDEAVADVGQQQPAVLSHQPEPAYRLDPVPPHVDRLVQEVGLAEHVHQVDVHDCHIVGDLELKR